MFWELTPKEMSFMVSAYIEKEKRTNEDNVSLAYMNAYWTAVWQSGKKPGSLDKILGRKEVKREMTPEQILQSVKALNKALGGK